MNSRMDKYVTNTSVKRRTSKNEKLYDEVSDMNIEGFELVGKEIIHETIKLQCNEDILSLFSMTPYYYKTSRSDKEKLEKLSELETQIHFCVAVYQRIT